MREPTLTPTGAELELMDMMAMLSAKGVTADTLKQVGLSVSKVRGTLQRESPVDHREWETLRKVLVSTARRSGEATCSEATTAAMFDEVIEAAIPLIENDLVAAEEGS